VKLHIIFTPPNLPLVRGGVAGGGVLSMHLHMEMVLEIKISIAEICMKSKLFEFI
jgi:hypothetical protein